MLDTLMLVVQNVVLVFVAMYVLQWAGVTRKTSSGVKLFFAGLVIALVVTASTILSL